MKEPHDEERANRSDKEEPPQLFPTAVSESDIQEARSKADRRAFTSSGIFHRSEPECEQLDLRGDLIIRNKVTEHYSKGFDAMFNMQFGAAATWFSKAVRLQPNQAPLFVSMAEAYLQLCDFQSAAVCYRRACFLEPSSHVFSSRLAFIYYMQGQCLWDQGMYFDALESFTKASELKPDCRVYYIRSLACLTALGRYADCLRLVSTWLEVDTPTADLLTLRARLYHHLRQVGLCCRDLRAALALGEQCPEAQRLLCQLEEAGKQARRDAVSRAVAGELPEALLKINIALEHSPEEGDHYLFRGVLYRRLKDFTAAINDLVLALELNKASDGTLQREARDQLVLTYNDFAVHCFSREFYSEAAALLNKAIEDQKNESGLYINRGDCFFKLSEWHFALADYQQAEELDPGDRAVWVRLAVVHNTLGLHSFQDHNYQEAADKFSVAIQYNPGVSLYHANRARARWNLGDVEGTKRDAIGALVLEPSNDQVGPLLLALFPGRSISDILASQAAKMVRSELKERLQACRGTEYSTSLTMSRLASRLDSSTLMESEDGQLGEHGSSVSEDLKKALTACVPQRDVYQELVSNKQQADQAVKRAFQQRLSLCSNRPHLARLPPVQQDESGLGLEQRTYSWRKFAPIGLRF